MKVAPSQTVQLHDGALGVPQGGGVGVGDHHRPVGVVAGQMETHPQPRRGVDQAVVVGLPDAVQQRFHLLRCNGHGPGRQGGCQQVQLGILGVLHHGILQRTSPGDDVGEVHQSPVAEPQCQIQIPQGDVAVQTQGMAPQRRQRQPHIGCKGGLACAALAGDDCYDFTQFYTSLRHLKRKK